MSPNKGDVAFIIRSALDDFNKCYKKPAELQAGEKGFSKVLVTGFSRGGAIARRFASIINDLVADQIIIEGIFDTVASIGIPNMSQSSRPKSDVVFENQSLPKNVEKAIHLVSLDDKRDAFQPTLMNQESKVLEVWFAGAHSDVGGGYYYDGLSDISLRFFLDWFEDLNLGLQLKTSKNIDFKNIFPEGEKSKIDADDVQVDPNPFGKNHEQDRFAVLEALTLMDRRCCVIKNDRIAEDEKPTVHSAVAERISGDRNYRPKSLKGVDHKIVFDHGEPTKDYTGISEHKLASMRSLDSLNVNDSKIVPVYAYRKFNHSRIYFNKDEKYKLEVVAVEGWRDGGIKNLDGNGWDRDDVQLGFKEWAIKWKESSRRVPDADWFTLCGSIGDDDKTAFKIGQGPMDYTAAHSGKFCAFANDLDGYYGNNSGKLKIKITRIA